LEAWIGWSQTGRDGPGPGAFFSEWLQHGAPRPLHGRLR
jgi:hypothetical protein